MLNVFGASEESSARRLIQLALAEDLGDGGDITSQILIDQDARGAVDIVSRDVGVLSGVPVGSLVLEAVDPACEWITHHEDGETIGRGTCVATLRGPVRSLLQAERSILNFMTPLSGIASVTRRFVDAVAQTKAVILDTRKTLPGWRTLQKYAVRCGGGVNHRMGLWDAVLIKDNHLAARPGKKLSNIITHARRTIPAGMTIEIEVDSLEQLQEALDGRPEIVLLDNMTPDMLRQAVALRDEQAPEVMLEASGRVRLETVGQIAASGVDRISIGLLTHSAPALDLGFDWHG